MGNLSAREAERFYTLIEPSGDCLIYNGSLDRDGYGMFFLRDKNRRAHRVAWFDKFGEIPEGLVVNHTCRRRNCVNHQHLQTVTRTENSKRDSTSVAYINSQKTRCPRGHEYDKTVMWGGKPQRVCTPCTNTRQAINRKRRAQSPRAQINV